MLQSHSPITLLASSNGRLIHDVLEVGSRHSRGSSSDKRKVESVGGLDSLHVLVEDGETTLDVCSGSTTKRERQKVRMVAIGREDERKWERKKRRVLTRKRNVDMSIEPSRTSESGVEGFGEVSGTVKSKI